MCHKFRGEVKKGKVVGRELLVLKALKRFRRLIRGTHRGKCCAVIYSKCPSNPTEGFTSRTFRVPMASARQVTYLYQRGRVSKVLASFSSLLLRYVMGVTSQTKVPYCLGPRRLP